LAETLQATPLQPSAVDIEFGSKRGGGKCRFWRRKATGLLPVNQTYGRRLFHNHSGLASDLEPLAAAKILAGHHVILAHHVRPEFGEAGAIPIIGPSGKLALLGTHDAGDFVVC